MFKINLFSKKLITLRLIVLSVLFLSVGFALTTQMVKVKSETGQAESNPDQTSEIKVNTVSPVMSPSPSPTPDQTPHTLVGTYYDTQNFPSAKLLLNNKDIYPREVRPTLYSIYGLAFEVPPVTVEANSSMMVNLHDWVTLAGPLFGRGNIKLFHTGKDLVIGSQIYMEDPTRSLGFECRLTELGKFDSRRLESVWWMPPTQAEANIVVTNTTDAPLLVTTTLSGAPVDPGVPDYTTAMFYLLPHETRVLNPRHDFGQIGTILANLEVLSLSITHTGAKDALIALTMIKDEVKGYSTVAAFSNPGGAKSNEYHGTGLHIGALGNDILKPVIVLKNTTNNPVSVTIYLQYTDTNGEQKIMKFLPIHLIPRQIYKVNTLLIENLADVSIAGLKIIYTGEKGSIVAQAQSVSENRNQVFRVPLADPLAQVSSTGGYPWRIEGTSRTVSYIKNMTDLEQEYVAHLTWENGGMYMIGLKKLAPNKTIEIDVKKLRDEQTPDERGNLIPLTLNGGQIKWTIRSKYETGDKKIDEFALIGRSEQIDTIGKISSNYVCQSCCYQQGSAYVLPDGEEFEVGDMVQFEALEFRYDCYGWGSFYTITNNINWSSNDTNIATVNSSGQVTIQGVGNAEIEARWTTPYAEENNNCSPGPLLVAEAEGEKPNEEIETTNAAPCGTCTLRYRQVSPDADVNGKPKIRILRNGNVISNPTTTTNVVVGEKIELITTVQGGTPSSKQWTIPGTKIANYVVNYTSGSTTSSGVLTELTSQNLTQSSIQFYWVDGADSRNVQYSITIGNRTYSATAKFNVKRPTVSVTTATNTTTIFTTGQAQRQFLLFGARSILGTETAGINFARNNFQVPTGFSGDSVWVQKINYSYQRTLTDGQTIQTASGNGLDMRFPYSSNDPNSEFTSDLPGVCLRRCNDSTEIIRMQARIDAEMWLMFKPSGNNSIYVPLRKVIWYWSASATRGSDMLFTTDPNPSNSDNPSGEDTTSFPQWTTLVTGDEPFQ